jgi:molybdopterin adenylyltransferase
MPSAAVITVSSEKAAGAREDRSGPKLAGQLEAIGAEVAVIEIVPDDRAVIAGRLRHWVEERIELVATAGGVGFSADDVTPEATFELIDRYTPGLVEAMRASYSPAGWLSRAVAGIAGGTLIVNFPDDEGAIELCMGAIGESLLAAVAAVAGRSPT